LEQDIGIIDLRGSLVSPQKYEILIKERPVTLIEVPELEFTSAKDQEKLIAWLCEGLVRSRDAYGQKR
jgi:hypothetical protein